MGFYIKWQVDTRAARRRGRCGRLVLELLGQINPFPEAKSTSAETSRIAPIETQEIHEDEDGETYEYLCGDVDAVL